MTAQKENMEKSLYHVNITKASCGGEMMTEGDMRKPEDPFNFHVYIGFSQENEAVVQPVIHKLKTALNPLCRFRGNGEIFDTDNEEAIKHSIASSEKCLLFITPEYMKDRWFEAEVNAAVEKARRFSRGMLFVLKDSRVPAESLIDVGLNEMQVTVWFTAVDDDTLSNQLVSWLRQDVELAPISELPGELSGYFEAFVYYYGFLNLILHDQRQDMQSMAESSSEITSSGAKVVLPILIVVPESCNGVPTSFDVEDKITTCAEYVMTVSDRGGSVNRDFKRPVMKMVTDAEKNDVIYFSADFPAILLTVYETYKASQTGLTKNQLDEICRDFFTTLQSLLCHPDNQHCIDQYRLVSWPDSRVDLYDFLLPIVRDAAEERQASSLVVDASRSRGGELMKSSFSRLESKNTNLRKLAGASEPYVMRDTSPRGICLIINISDVTPTSDTNVQQLQRLFSDQFDFDVRVHIDKMTWDQLDTLLCNVAQEDHNRYDAFICYLASPGRLGSVCTSDGISNSVVTLVSNFITNNREQLQDKPKLFLMQTSDDGTTDIWISDEDKTEVSLYSTLRGYYT